MLKNKKILTIVAHDFDDLEYYYPVIRLKEAGAIVHTAGLKKNETYHGKYGLKTTSDLSFDEVNISMYDCLLIPGGWAPDLLRRFESVLKMVRFMHENKRIIGAICHAGWVLSSAGILKGVEMTSTPGIKDDMIYAGAIWFDQPVVRSGHIITARRPPDLPYYLPELIKALEK